MFGVKIAVFQVKSYLVTLCDMDYKSNYYVYRKNGYLIVKILQFLKKFYNLYTMCGELL